MGSDAACPRRAPVALTRMVRLSSLVSTARSMPPVPRVRHAAPLAARRRAEMTHHRRTKASPRGHHLTQGEPSGRPARGRASGPPDGAWSALKSPPAAAPERATSTEVSRRGSRARMDRERLRHDGAPGNRSTVGRGTGPRQRREAPPTEVGRRAGTSGVDRPPRGGVRSDGVARAASTWSVPSGARARTGGASRSGRSSTRARSSAWEQAGRAASHASGAPQARRVTSETAGAREGR